MADLWFAAAVFAASTVLCGATFFGIDPLERVPQLWLMHGFALAVFFMYIGSTARKIRDPEDAWMGRNPTWLRRQGLDLLFYMDMGENIGDPKDVEAWMKRNAPWLGRLVLVLFLNAAACLIVVFAVGRGGWPEKRGNKFVAVSGGTVVRELTAAEYRTSHNFAIRIFPSFWMAFSGYPLLVMIAKHKARSDDPFPVGRPPLRNRLN